MAIETSTDKNEIGRVKHHKVGAARAENGPDVYKKDRESRKNVLDMFTRTCLIHRPYRTYPLIATGIGKIELVSTYLVSPKK